MAQTSDQQETKPDVKAIMARFNTQNSASTEGASGAHPALHQTFSTGTSSQPRRMALENSLSGNTTGLKTSARRNTESSQSTTEAAEFPRTKIPTAKHGAAPEDGKSPFPKPLTFKSKPLDTATDSEPNPPPPKPIPQKPPVSGTISDTKPPIPKPPPTQNKPLWKDSTKSEEVGSGTSPTKPVLAKKPKSTLVAIRSQVEETSAGDLASKPGSNLRNSAFRAAQSAFNKENAEDTSRDGPKPVNSQDALEPKPLVTKKPSVVRKPPGLALQKENTDPNAPKKNPLPNIFALGSPPAKPNRPPKVNLEKFKKGVESNSEGLKKGSPSQPPASHLSNNVAPPVPSQPAAPSLPPRPTLSEPDEYDDIGGFPNQRHEGSDSDEETYEDLDSKWSSEAKEGEKKWDKEGKKKLEQEKREQKERERKEQDMRKKFKLSGSVQVIHKVKARVDCKGGKMDLSVKQGDPIEIIRIKDNPEGRWLGRTRDGSYGYIKTESVEIDFDTLKRQGIAIPSLANVDQDLYDDVASQDTTRVVRGPGVVLPPPPGEDGEIYDDLDESDLNVRVPPPPQFTPEGNAASSVDELYDDVDTSISSIAVKPKSKVEDKDPKKQKKFEKEEKEFRKKFKFEGEIQVLYQVTVLTSLTGKKWSAKELALRPGETLDVIVKAVDGKLVCRNDEGKFGYVSTSNIVTEDLDIYDDIGDDSIYDND